MMVNYRRNPEQELSLRKLCLLQTTGHAKQLLSVGALQM